MNYVMKYAVVEMDWDACFYDLIALFDDINDAQEMVLAIFQEQQYEDFCDYLFFDTWTAEETGEATLENFYNSYKNWRYPWSSADCNFEVKEVPYFGC